MKWEQKWGYKIDTISDGTITVMYCTLQHDKKG